MRLLIVLALAVSAFAQSPWFHVGNGTPYGVNCTQPGLDQYFDTSALVNYTCTAAGMPGKWKTPGTANTAALVTSVGSPGLDTNVPSEKAIATALAAYAPLTNLASYAPLASPTFTGGVTAPGYLASGAFPTITGCGTISATSGGATAGQFTTNTTGTCAAAIPLPTAPHGWTCYVQDLTQHVATNILIQTASTASSCTVTGTTAASDVLTFLAVGW